jgi:hypothetical protein
MISRPSKKAATPYTGLYPIWRMWALAYYRWALKEIDPMHPDLGLIVYRINQLERSA